MEDEQTALSTHSMKNTHDLVQIKRHFLGPRGGVHAV